MKLPYQEGDWFAVPLRSGGYGIGLVARCDREDGVLGYFFGPKRTEAPTLPEVVDLQPKDSVRALNFGDLGLIEGDWPIIGRAPSWDREQWPIPAFARRDPLGGRSWKVIYNDDLIKEREELLHKGEGSELQNDSVLGSGAVELELTSLLDPSTRQEEAIDDKTLPYEEGTWFAVPLGYSSGYGVGVVARVGNDEILVYFFGPKREEVPDLSQVDPLCAKDAVQIYHCDHQGLIRGRCGLAPIW